MSVKVSHGGNYEFRISTIFKIEKGYFVEMYFKRNKSRHISLTEIQDEIYNEFGEWYHKRTLQYLIRYLRLIKKIPIVYVPNHGYKIAKSKRDIQVYLDILKKYHKNSSDLIKMFVNV